MTSRPATALPRDFPGGCLRRLRADDLEAFQAYRSIPALGRYQGWSPMSDGQALEFLVEMSQAPLFTPGRWLQLGIATADAGLLLGDIGLFFADDGLSGEVGFTLHPAAQGRGLATAAVHEASQLLFGATAARRLLGITDARNTPSVRLLERLGFVYLERRELVFRGEPCVERVYSLARPHG
jgi:RimJ/RimL family protein N-acetyltransferase